MSTVTAVAKDSEQEMLPIINVLHVTIMPFVLDVKLTICTENIHLLLSLKQNDLSFNIFIDMYIE